MDIRTGKTYETYEDAIKAGVPESDIALVRIKNRQPYVTFPNPKYPNRFQGARECAKRLAKMERENAV